MRRLAGASQGPGSVYFTGGATMLLLGVREQTIDVDIKLDPEPRGVFEAIATLKNVLDLNIELASPDDFLPPLPDWRENSLPIATIGNVRFFHYDFRAQALAKLERGHRQDIGDVTELLRRGFVVKQDLLTAWNQIKPTVIRYPAINSSTLERKIIQFLDSVTP